MEPQTPHQSPHVFGAQHRDIARFGSFWLVHGSTSPGKECGVVPNRLEGEGKRSPDFGLDRAHDANKDLEESPSASIGFNSTIESLRPFEPCPLQRSRVKRSSPMILMGVDLAFQVWANAFAAAMGGF